MMLFKYLRRRNRSTLDFYRALKLLCVCLLWSGATAHAQANTQSDYVGAETCKNCHEQAYQQWQTSDHFKAMAEATEKTVLGNFNNHSVNFHAIKTRFYTQEKHYFVDTLGADNKTHTFRVDYVFGHFPLQQYLVDKGDGHYQALNIAWDSRTKSDGGQRWYHLQPDEKMTAENPFFWTGHFQNWNSRCGECHTTNFQKNYDSNTHQYNTQWTDINVACEACHGPGKKHVDLANAQQLSQTNTGFLTSAEEPIKWQFEKNDPIANPIGKKSDRHIDMCGGCHSRRLPIAETHTQGKYHDKYRLTLLEESLYFDDGQIQDEVFVLGSFLQSKMHHAGVSCNNCHNPHTGKTLTQDNNLCAQCHQPTTYDTQKHHGHPLKSEGALCVNCHMPTRTYMQVDDRRDHQFTIPNPALSQLTNAPNACTGCHDDQDNSWAIKSLESWGKTLSDKHWSRVMAKSRQLDTLAFDILSKAAEDESLAAITRATLIHQLRGYPPQLAQKAAAKHLKNPDPLIRRAAVAVIANAEPQTRWQMLSPLFKDTHQSVRFELATAMADLIFQLPENMRTKIQSLIDEYRQSLEVTADFPSSQVAIANLENQLEHPEKAKAAYEKALKISPSHIPALLNLADTYRASGEIEKEFALLKQAMTLIPESGAVRHSYGLYLIRHQRYTQALPHLKLATEALDAQPRFAYVYAVALDHNQKTGAAIAALQKANQRWPNQFDLLSTLVMYLDKTGKTDAIYEPLTALARLAPRSPQVLQLLQKYSK